MVTPAHYDQEEVCMELTRLGKMTFSYSDLPPTLTLAMCPTLFLKFQAYEVTIW